MACPYFEPERRAARLVDFRLPLGAFWLGRCHSPLATEGPLVDEHQLECCNAGFARGRCVAFPADAAADAVRFAQRPSGVLFILERESGPVSWGPVEEIEPGSVLDRQRKAWNTT